MRTCIILLALALAGCQRAASPEVVGTYQLTSPYFDNMVGRLLNQRLILTPDRAIVAIGSQETAADYDVQDGFVYLISGDTRVGYRILGPDTLRYEGPLSPMPLDYVRVNP